MKVILINKVTKEETVLIDDITEQEAESFCEAWGWNYDDGYKSYWLGLDD